MKIIHLASLLLFVHSANAALVTITDPLLSDWGSSNPSSVEGTDYYLEDGSGADELVFNYIASTVTHLGTAFSAQNAGDRLSFNLSLTPSYTFAGGTGGLFWYEDGSNVGADYLAVRYAYTGTQETSEIYFEANVGGVNSNVTLAQGFSFDGALNFDVEMLYSASNEWVLSGQISSDNAVLWDSSVTSTAAIASTILTTDNEIFFGANDYTHIGTGPFSRLSGSFGVVPEPAVVALLMGLLSGACVFFRRR
ncbi:PEP-CTERM sorting domain-containing protein [Coraliomargarita sp. W4R72]